MGYKILTHPFIVVVVTSKLIFFFFLTKNTLNPHRPELYTTRDTHMTLSFLNRFQHSKREIFDERIKLFKKSFDFYYYCYYYYFSLCWYFGSRFLNI